jgi:glycosyltransferase involved in cell wall biosynthesis
MEAMSASVPIVALGTSSIPETVLDAGIVLDEWNELLFACRMAHVTKDPEIASAVKRKGRLLYQDRFSPQVLRKTVQQLAERWNA